MTSTDPAQAKPVRALFGGVLMGLANLVPGVSGGTMILALGLYDAFIGAIADVTRLRFRRASVMLLALVGVGAVGAILGLSGVAVGLVQDHRWVMYSLFIGMTLGGAPDLWKQTRPLSAGVAVAFAASVALMAWLAWSLVEAHIEPSVPVLIGIGALAASSMILPGVSGSYLLLIFGMYDLVIGAASASRLIDAPVESAWILGPVVLGAGLGIALLSNVLKTALAAAPRVSHAALLGLLVGSVLGLWPFREPVHPELLDRDVRKGVELLAEGASVEEIEAARGLDWTAAEAEDLSATYAGKSRGELKLMSRRLRGFEPDAGQVAAALGLLVLGFAVTRTLGRHSGSDVSPDAR